MAKKTTKTTVKHTKKGTVTKTVTKSSKKGLIIGISIGVAVAIAAGVTIPLVLMNMNKGGSSDVKFKITANEIKLEEGDKTAKVELDWTPSDHSIECDKFTFSLLKQTDITSTIVPENTDSRPLKLAITFDKPLGKEDEGELKFHYNDKTAKKEGDGKIKGIGVKLHDTPVTESWILKLDGDSKDFGKFENGEESIERSTIGEETDTIYFAPETGYEETQFIVTATSGDYEINYSKTAVKKGMHSIVINKNDGTFAKDERIELHFEVPEATISLDTEDYGTLETTDISEYVGETSIFVNFIPKDDYIGKPIYFNASGTGFSARYDLGNQQIILTGDNPLEHKANLLLTVQFATVTLDDASFNTYGTFQNGVKTVSVGGYIDATIFQTVFIPKSGYENTDFNVTCTGAAGQTITATYQKDGTDRKINFSVTGGTGTLVKDTELTVTLTEPSTLALDTNSQKFGDLSYGSESGSKVDISDVIGESSVEIGFTPKSPYNNGRSFTVSISLPDDFDVEYSSDNKKITITGKGTRVLKAGDNLVVTVIPEYFILTADPNNGTKDPYDAGHFTPTQNPTQPDDPTAPVGRKFVRWHSLKDGLKFLFNKPLTEDTTIEAHYGVTNNVTYQNSFTEATAVGSKLTMYHTDGKTDISNNDTQECTFDFNAGPGAGGGMIAIINWQNEEWSGIDAENPENNVTIEFTASGSGQSIVISQDQMNVRYDEWEQSGKQCYAIDIHITGTGYEQITDGGTLAINVYPISDII